MELSKEKSVGLFVSKNGPSRAHKHPSRLIGFFRLKQLAWKGLPGRMGLRGLRLQCLLAGRRYHQSGEGKEGKEEDGE
jgi:hypothetical protein